MRITNKIMQNNSLRNINSNKILQDKLNTQITSQSKITRPSDDPVVAIRALRLRTDLSEATQYYEKNVPDAEQWLSITESSLDSVSSVITDMSEECVDGSKSYLQASDRLKIVENLKALRDEVYSTGDASYAGRNIFTGYRTEVSLAFKTDTTLPYKITEQLTKDALSSITYVDSSDVLTTSAGNFQTVTATEVDITANTVNRIRLAYDNCSTTAPTITFGDPATSVTATVMSSTGATDPYMAINEAANAGAAIFVPETGELLLGSDLYTSINQLGTEEEVRITYDKSAWEQGDLRPEHYFACTSNPGTADEVVYNPGYLTGDTSDVTKQIISYDVGTNQELRVNTLASECFTHDIGRDIDELVRETELLDDIEATITTLTKLIDSGSYSVADTTVLQEKLDAAEKVKTLQGDKVQKMYESAITSMQGYLDQTSLAITNVGSRSARLELIDKRLQSQQTNFKALASENEGADVTELAIQLKSAEISYDAALLATSTIIQSSLLDYLQ